jgi:gamma-glutamylcyclotransferase
VTYVAGDRHIDTAGVPFDWYRDLVVAGAVEHGLPPSYVEELAQIPAVSDPYPARAERVRGLLGGA